MFMGDARGAASIELRHDPLRCRPCAARALGRTPVTREQPFRRGLRKDRGHGWRNLRGHVAELHEVETRRRDGRDVLDAAARSAEVEGVDQHGGVVATRDVRPASRSK